MYDKDKDYCYFPHEEFCDLLFAMESKDNRNRAAAQIKRLAAKKVVLADSDSNASPRVTYKKKDKTGVLPARNNQGRNIPKHRGSQRYCMMCNDSVMTERKYKFAFIRKLLWMEFQPGIHRGRPRVKHGQPV